MTAADPKQPSVELEDGVSQWPGNPDHLLVQKGVCESHGYQRSRTAGWVFSSPQPGAQPLYRCYAEAEDSWAIFCCGALTDAEKLALSPM
jgi:hypothetical protein